MLPPHRLCVGRIGVIAKKTKVEFVGSPDEVSELLGSNQWTKQLSPTDNTWDILVVGLNTRLNKNVVRLIFDFKKRPGLTAGGHCLVLW